MKRCLLLVVLLFQVGTVRSEPATPADTAPTRTDAAGFPLPAGVYARLGSLRLMQPAMGPSLRYLADDVTGGQGEAPPKENEPVLTAQDLERIWGNFTLRDDEGVKKQYRDRNTLIQSPRQAVALLRERLKPVAAPVAQLLERRLDELDNNDFVTREKATVELEKMGSLAEPAIRKKLEGKPSLEGRRRMERILEKLKKEPSADELRAIRAVEVLENIGSPAAKELLEIWSRGAPGARLTEEARSALALLQRRARESAVR